MTNPFSWMLWMGFAWHWLVLGSVVVSGAVISVRAARRKRWPMVVTGIVLIISPVLLFTFQVANAEHHFAKRKVEIAEMRRFSLPVNYPRVLVVEGGVRLPHDLGANGGGPFRRDC